LFKSAARSSVVVHSTKEPTSPIQPHLRAIPRDRTAHLFGQDYRCVNRPHALIVGVRRQRAVR
jgi:hypothetical protein